ncbi:conserved hypothetical protein [Sphingobacterium sp. PM2-P1-29]|nr:conserved hypothetical protein [Sphingobacterium sp. PM2-P1-29]
MIKSIEDGRKEDGNRSIADKIIRRIHDLEKTVKNNHGRWGWELLQNAKDSVAETDRKVSVRIEFDSKKLKFSHNGNHFTEKDIRGLINQISSKEVEEGETSTRTGRFGTGFLTTHLLSKKVHIKGIVEAADKRLYKFDFLLDRNGVKTGTLIENIEAAWDGFHKSTEESEIEDYDPEILNTSFSYELESKPQIEIAEIGVDEFSELIPYVLAFIPEIKSVNIIDKVRNKTIFFKNQSGVKQGFKKITKTINGKSRIVRLLFATNDKIAIAARVFKNKNDHFEILPLDDIPKLFCNFPLIGTEDFHFPIIVNSFFFYPQTERDGIWLKGDVDSEVTENKELLEQALVLYKELIDGLEVPKYQNLFNIAKTKIPSTDEDFFDKRWYTESIQQPLRKFLLDKPLVQIEDGSAGQLNEIWFPLKRYNKETRENLWQYKYDLFPAAVSTKKDLHNWAEIIWDEINTISYSGLVEDIAKQKSVTQLGNALQMDDEQTIAWLNEVGKFIIAEEVNLILLEKNAIIPNKNGNFLTRNLLFIDKINDIDLVKVLQELGEDWNDILLHKKIFFAKYSLKKINDIAIQINERLKNTSSEFPGFKKAIIILSEWFDKNPEQGKDLFGETYRKRTDLFVNTIDDKESLYKVMKVTTDFSNLSKVAQVLEDNPRLFENIGQAEEMSSLLKQYQIEDISQLRNLLDAKSEKSEKIQALLPVTQEILADMGISSLKEWQDAIKDKDLAALYAHKSTPSTDMFVYAQSLIKKAKEQIKLHLEGLDDYDLDNVDETTAPTILAGILKNGREISVVTRPAYNGEVIIYYGSELNTLDFAESELWVDDGKKPRKISLGHLLKKTQIVKFPI